jgi:uncharacterized protein YecT (DUF1311 family)
MSTSMPCAGVALALALVASLVGAQQRPVAPCDQIETERLCVMQQLQAAEAELERTWRQARVAAGDSILVDGVHHAWRRYVEVDCRAAADVYRGGSLASIVGLHCRYEHARLRSWQMRGDYPADLDSLAPGSRDPRFADPEVFPTQAAEIRATVRGLLEDVAAGVRRDGPQAWRQYVGDHARTLFVSNGEAGVPDAAAAVELRWDSVHVDAITPSLAIVTAVYHETVRDAAGRMRTHGGWFTGVARREPAGWRWHHVHRSSSP